MFHNNNRFYFWGIRQVNELNNTSIDTTSIIQEILHMDAENWAYETTQGGGGDRKDNIVQRRGL